MMSVGPLITRAHGNGAVHDPARPSRHLGSATRTATLVTALIAMCVSIGYAQVLPPGWDVPVASVRQLDAAERGWIGVGVDITVREVTRGSATLEVRVVRTVDGGPAAVVGVVPGDVIRTIDGELITIERWQRFTQNLRPGVNLRLALDRAGRSREVRLTTARRPSLSPVPVGLTAYLDSVRTSFRTQLESGRGVWASRDYVTGLIAGGSVEEVSTRILDEARQNARSYVFRPGSNVDILAPSGQGANRYSVVWNTNAALPFEFLMLQSPEADSVKTAIIRLRGALTAVTEATRVREQEIRAIVEPTATRLGDSDAQLISLRLDNERVHEDLERLAIRLAEIGSSEREARIQVAGIGAEIAARIRPLTARVVGRSFVGGAQFTDLNPQLGEYFGTDHGVLVIQVLSGTPCDEAGLLPGDVVTHVGGVEIDSVEGFRTVLNQVFGRRRQAELTLMRRGERVAATLSR